MVKKGVKGVPAFSNAGHLGQSKAHPGATAAAANSSSSSSSNNNGNRSHPQRQQGEALSSSSTSSHDDLRAMIRNELGQLLGFESEEVVEYIMSIQSERDLQEYLLGGLLTAADPGARSFVERLCRRRFPFSLLPPPSSSSSASSGVQGDAGLVAYKKPAPEEQFQSTPRSPRKGSERAASVMQSSPSSSFIPASPKSPKSQSPSASTAQPAHSMVAPLPSSPAKPPIDSTPSTPAFSSAPIESDDTILTEQAKEIQKLRSKRTKFVNLYSSEGSDKLTFVAPGRNECNCLATKHALVNNCTSCGRIVCEQERPGPCFTCGEIVYSKEQMEVVLRDSKRGAKEKERLLKQFAEEEKQYKKHREEELRRQQALAEKARQQQLLSQGTAVLKPSAEGDTSLLEGYEKALQHKNKLLEFDRTSAKRTKVIDDESDYFAADNNRWLTPAQRDALRQKEADLRKQKEDAKKKITLDLSTRQVHLGEVPGAATMGLYDEGVELMTEDLVKQFERMSTAHIPVPTSLLSSSSSESSAAAAAAATSATSASPSFKPVFVSAASSEPAKPTKPAKQAAPAGPSSNSSQAPPQPAANQVVPAPRAIPATDSRIQDRALKEMSDGGFCLSMHQPWASLLVLGIKKAEGRSWYSSHRGRLWIASAALQPDAETVQQVEDMYRKIYKGNVAFPSEYPTGCLIGCVDVVDCITQEEYAAKHKDEDNESSSPFVFMCENPQKLIISFPVKGDHKIWKLDKSTHQLAKAGLRFI